MELLRLSSEVKPLFLILNHLLSASQCSMWNLDKVCGINAQWSQRLELANPFPGELKLRLISKEPAQATCMNENRILLVKSSRQTIQSKQPRLT
jgi:hypothetical protein